MSLIVASHDSLPYIEPAPTTSEKTFIASLINAELELAYKTKLHPSLANSSLLYEPTFTPFIQQELERIERGEPMTGGINLSRYEAPSAPSDNSAEAWESILQTAYVSSAHLGSRLTNLSLLSEFGKNAWLIHNAQLEELLKGLEEELMALKTQCEVINKERKSAQKDMEPELKRLEVRWKKGIGRVLDVELATESVRREIVERQRRAS